MTNYIDDGTPNEQEQPKGACPHETVQIKSWETQWDKDKGALMLVSHFWCVDCNTGWTQATEYEVEEEN